MVFGIHRIGFDPVGRLYRGAFDAMSISSFSPGMAISRMNRLRMGTQLAFARQQQALAGLMSGQSLGPRGEAHGFMLMNQSARMAEFMRHLYQPAMEHLRAMSNYWSNLISQTTRSMTEAWAGSLSKPKAPSRAVGREMPRGLTTATA